MERQHEPSAGPGPDAQDRRGSIAGADRRRQAGHLLGRVRRIGPHGQARGGVPDPDASPWCCSRRAPLGAQGRRALAQQSDQLCRGHRGVRRRQPRGRSIDLRAAVSHRPASVRPCRICSPAERWCTDASFDTNEWIRLVGRRGHHRRDRGADDAGSHRSHARAHGAADLPTLRNLAYGGSKVPLPLVRRRSSCSPKSVSSTRTASPRRARPSRCSAPTITATRLRRRR